MDEFTTKEYYINIASTAVVAEQNRNWQYAAQLWAQAETLARQSLNRDWSAMRMEFCMRQLRYSEVRPQMKTEPD